MASPLAREHALVWGSRQRRRLEGGTRLATVPPVHRPPRLRRVLRAARAHAAGGQTSTGASRRRSTTRGIPVVLLDRTVVPYPERGASRSGRHRQPPRRLHHHRAPAAARRAADRVRRPAETPRRPSTAREAGYREALYAWDMPIDRALVHRLDPDDPGAVRAAHGAARPDAIVCANDRTAGAADAYAARASATPSRATSASPASTTWNTRALLPVPLTTLRQPTRQIGDAALAAMLERVRRPSLPPREVLLDCELVVRASCGGAA